MKTCSRVLLLGGLGNNFFQLARAIELKKKGNVEILYIGNFYKYFYFFLGHTSHEKWLDMECLINSLGFKYRSINFFEFLTLVKIYLMKSLNFQTSFDQELSKSKEKTLQVGYFQTEKHVKLDSIEEVAKKINNLIDVTKFKIKDILVVHVRGTDIGNENRIKKSYFDEILSYCDKKNIEFSIITDDINFSKKLIKDVTKKIKIFSKNPRDDFMYFVSSKYILLSNSTFSFWGGICSRLINPEVKIFGTENWKFTPFIDVDILKDSLEEG